MLIRPAELTDLESIIHLFKISLGDKGGAPNVSFWKWKHYRNPFGESPTLLAFEKDKLVGLRTFLVWQFRYRGQVFKAYRAVDTATHPDFRGKGIFTKLTLQLIEVIAKREPCIVFNTPNKSSLPGYLKMGWRKMGRTPLTVMPTPRYWLSNRKEEVTIGSQSMSGGWSEIENEWEYLNRGLVNAFDNQVCTDYSVQMLKWRYCDIPGIKYHQYLLKKHGSSCLMFFRIKHSARLREVRITDVFFSRYDNRLFKEALHDIISASKPDLVTMLTDGDQTLSRLQPRLFMPVPRFGLNMTYREVNDPSLTRIASDRKNWYLSAGTIELL